jgi:hypothetical protein
MTMTDNHPVSPEGREAARRLAKTGDILLKLKGLKYRPHLIDLFVEAIAEVEAQYPGATAGLSKTGTEITKPSR